MQAADTAQLFRRCIDALNQSNVAEAEACGQRLLVLGPNDAAVLQLMAQIRMAAGKLAEAERFASASLSLRPNHPATLLLGGRIAWAAGDWALAEARLRRANTSASQGPEAAFALCAFLIEAEAGWPTVLASLHLRFQNHGTGWVEIGRVLERKGEGKAALAAYDQAAKTLSAAPLHSARGGLLHAEGQLDLASEALNRAVTMDPGLVLGWFKLGLLRQDQHDLSGAVAAYRQALTLRPDLAEAETNLGVVLQEMGDLPGAKRAYGRAILLRPDSFGPIAQALTMAPVGEVWMDLAALRAHLEEEGRLAR